MKPTFFEDHINQKKFDVFFENLEFAPSNWQRFFPFKFSALFTYTSVIGSDKRAATAALVSYNSRGPKRVRKILKTLSGTIEPLKVERYKDEKDMNEFNVMEAMGADEAELAKFIYDDAAYVAKSIEQMIEYLCMQILFHQAYSLDATNNAGGIETVYEVNYGLDATHNRVVKSSSANRQWPNPATALPITDFRVLEKAARDAGIRLKFVAMNWTKAQEFANAEEVKMFVGMGTNPDYSTQPEIRDVNAKLLTAGLPQVMVIDSLVDQEDASGNTTTVDPTLDGAGSDKFITFMASTDLGNVLHTTVAFQKTDKSKALVSSVGPIAVKEWYDDEEEIEWTRGQLNQGVTLPAIDKMYAFNTEANDATGIA